MTDFSRTLQTADDAEGIARLLTRVANSAGRGDAARLNALAERYTDYAKSLRETAASGAEPDPEQAVLL